MTGYTYEQELVLLARALLEARNGTEGEGTRYARALVAAADAGRRGMGFGGRDGDLPPAPRWLIPRG